jgi:hypothetical protein
LLGDRGDDYLQPDDNLDTDDTTTLQTAGGNNRAMR